MSYTETTTRLLQLTEAIDTFVDPDFDIAFDELEREFAELRLTFDHN